MSPYPYNLPEDHPDRLMELDYQQQKEDEERARTEPGFYESKPITTRVVRRWFFNGKGYSTKRNAYTAKAKKMMVEMVLGPMIERFLECDDGEAHWNQLENDPRNGKAMTKEESREAIDARFAVFFPHVDSFECDQECRRVNQEYDQWGRCICEGDFEFQSCKGAQRRWLEAKVKELMAAEVAQ